MYVYQDGVCRKVFVCREMSSNLIYAMGGDTNATAVSAVRFTLYFMQRFPVPFG